MTEPRRRWAAIGLLVFVVLLDLLWAAVHDSTASSEFALVDEPAHMATALLFLLALSTLLGRELPVGFVLGALVASVALDLDHLPRYLGWDGLTAGVPRPYSHSLLTVACLVVIAALVRRRIRPAVLGAAFGVFAHLARDAATGPGVALLWPATSGTVRVPYVVFVAALALAVALVLALPSQQTR